jgi:2-(1,2-epoxy-1,2-dihydrophenyl)acetyl-CoA isomerase
VSAEGDEATVLGVRQPGPDEAYSYEVTDSGVAWFVLNRPEAGHALTAEVQKGLIDSLDSAGADLRVRVIVLTATGVRHFCTGADLRSDRGGEPDRPADAPERPTGTVMRELQRMNGAQATIAAVLDCPKPVIAAVNGTAAGMGVQLALACDIIVSAEHAKFIQLFVRRAIMPGGGSTYLLPRLVGPQKAKELLFFGDDLPAAEAYRIGLVNRVVPSDQLSKVVGELADRLATLPTVTIGLIKRLVNCSFESDRAAAFQNEAFGQETNMQTADSVEGVQSWIERREPRFRGW